MFSKALLVGVLAQGVIAGGYPTSDRDVSPAVWSTPSQIVVTNIISIQENSTAMDEELKLLNNFLEQVYLNEPGVELFLLNRDDAHFQYVTLEIYSNQNAVDIHLASPYMAALLQAETDGGLKRADNDVHLETLVSQIGPRHLA
ncbi:hypothetical protein F5884DRAFT_877610 [Xylogone sp. PMI_703]|nr:hypothetical protein F5884DRAFT_877610 [Xylogone sp. PMI_703]